MKKETIEGEEDLEAGEIKVEEEEEVDKEEAMVEVMMIGRMMMKCISKLHHSAIKEMIDQDKGKARGEIKEDQEIKEEIEVKVKIEAKVVIDKGEIEDKEEIIE